MLAASFYLTWIWSLATEIMVLISTLSIVVGLAAALLWNSMAACVNHEAPKRKGEKSFGNITSFYGALTCAGLLAISGLLYADFELQTTFLILSPTIVVGIVLFSFLPKMEKPQRVPFNEFWATFRSGTIWRLSTISMVTFIIFGLLVSVIPLHVDRVMGVEGVGWLQSGAFLILGFSFYFGGLIYKIGIKKVAVSAYLAAAIGILVLALAESAIPVAIAVLLVCSAFPPLFIIMLGLAELAPEHKKTTALAIFTAADDLAIFTTLELSEQMFRKGISLNYLYWGTLIFTLFSLAIIYALLRGDGDEAREKLVRDTFPAPKKSETTVAQRRSDARCVHMGEG